MRDRWREGKLEPVELGDEWRTKLDRRTRVQELADLLHTLEKKRMRKVASFFFLATIFCCTFEKVHWAFGSALALSDVLAIGFIVAYVATSRPTLPRTSADAAAVRARVRDRVPARLLQPRHGSPGSRSSSRAS